MFRKIFLLLAVLTAIQVAKADDEKKQKSPLQTIVIDPGHGGIDGGAQGSYTREAWVALKIGLKLRELLNQQCPDIKVLMTREKDELPGGLNNINSALRWRANFANDNNADLFVSIHLNSSPARYERRQVGTTTKRQAVFTGKGKKRKVTSYREVEVPVYQRFKMDNPTHGSGTYILARDWYNIKKRAVGSKHFDDGVAPDSTSTDSTQFFEEDPMIARIKADQYTRYFFQKSYTLASYVEDEFLAIGRKSWGVLQRDWDGIWVLQGTQMPSILIETGYVNNRAEEEYLDSDKGVTETAQCALNAIKRYKAELEGKAGQPAESAPVIAAPVSGTKTK
jgi:N-acetylmuramoyl-L-alanine amidase